MEQKLALFYGILAGDGCLSRSGNKYFISICGNLKDDRLFYDTVLIPLLDGLRHKTTIYKMFPNHNKIEVNLSDKQLFTKLRDLNFPVGRKIHQSLSLPKELDSSVTYFIAGVMATDGSLWFRTKGYKKPYPVVGIKNKSKTLVSQLYNYLTCLGFNPKLREVKYKNRSTKGEYEIAIYGYKYVKRFREIIGFVNPKHEIKYTTHS